MKLRVALSAAVLASAFAANDARAQDASSQAAAQALFEQARQLMDQNNFAEACPKLAESERLDPGAGTLLNLGRCYEKNGQTASAWVTYKDAAAAADMKHRADWSQRAREWAAAIEPQLSKLTIDVPADSRVDGLQVRRDGVEVGSAVWGTAIPIDPGDHAVEAVAPGKKPWKTTVTVKPGPDQAHAAIPALEAEPPTAPVEPAPLQAPPPQAPPTPPPVEPPPPASSTQRTVAFVAGGAGVVGIAVGAVLGVVAMGQESSSKSLCPTSACTNPAAISDNDSANKGATAATVAMVVGGVALGTGVVLYLTAPKGAPATGLRVTPTLTTAGAGLNLGGAW
jgi:serine/threonine-protein kinase